MSDSYDDYESKMQEPVAWLSTDCIGERYLCFTKPKDNAPVQPLYTAPSKQWVGLTDEEHDSIKHNYHNMTWTLEMFARAIEQALKEKNHG